MNSKPNKQTNKHTNKEDISYSGKPTSSEHFETMVSDIIYFKKSDHRSQTMQNI